MATAAITFSVVGVGNTAVEAAFKFIAIVHCESVGMILQVDLE